MSVTALPVLRVQGSARQALALDHLRAIPSEALSTWLLDRRWFGAKGHSGATPSIDQVIPISYSEDPNLGFAIVLATVALPSGESSLYQLPLATAAEPSSSAGDALALVEHDSGTSTIVDAVTLPEFRAALGRAFREGARFASADGEASWEVQNTGTGQMELPDETRVSSAEQSNTSVIFGDQAVCKLFRRLEPGENPDVEISRFLTTRTDFRQCPALLGAAVLRRTGTDYTAAAMNRFVAGASDAWSVALDSVTNFLGADSNESDFSDEAHQLGAVTRRLHEALASDEDDPAFAPVFATSADISRWTSAAIRMLDDSFQLLENQAKSLEGSTRDHARALLQRRGALADRITALGSTVDEQGDPGMRIRHHGDYHLGQVLESPEGDWLIIDFEGEPARTLTERRELHSPLRDVAGMMRSLAYAAAAASMATGGLGRDPRLESRAARWERNARENFLAGYLEPGERVLDAILPATADGVHSLLALFEAEKALYELAYELNNRPAWAWIPLRGIAKML